jgi:hypothetical protein
MIGNGIALVQDEDEKLSLLVPLVPNTGAVVVNRNPVAETPPPPPSPPVLALVAFVHGYSGEEVSARVDESAVLRMGTVATLAVTSVIVPVVHE